MKKQYFFIITLFLILSQTVKSQVLNVPQIIQEQTEWCWSACSKCILDYYGYVSHQQCNIAEYARTQQSGTFGTVNCCTDVTQGCNNPNYMYNQAGSIQDIIQHFGNINSTGISNVITLPQIVIQCSHNEPFVVRWGWISGGGHFVVGHGVMDSNVYYMNPLVGEGLHVSTYDWLVADGNHTWTNTLELTSAPTGINEASVDNSISIYPNPTKSQLTISNLQNASYQLSITDIMGREVYTQPIINQQSSIINLPKLSNGVYFYQLTNNTETYRGKFVKE